jgi:hypothetical protein
VDDLHPCRQGDARHLVEEELGDCYLEEEELDGHLVQFEQLVQLVQAMLLAQMRQEKLSLAQQALPAQ